MKLYRQLFFRIYTFIKVIEGGFSYQTDLHRAWVTVFLISLLELFNLLTIFPMIFKGYTVLIPFLILFIINHMIFAYNKKYKMIIESCKNVKNDLGYSIIVILYAVFTLILFERS